MCSFLKQIRKLRHRKQSMDVIFSEFYRKKLWGKSGSLSGAGSDLIQTSFIRKEVAVLLKQIGAKLLMDAPCGDFHWMQEAELDSIKYLGIDVVSDLVAQNQRRYGNAIREFINLDISKDSLPRADVILCRDCLVHFSFEHILSTIRNFKKSQSEYLLTTTFPKVSVNKDIVTGDWRPINLQLAPFHFPNPFKLISEHCTEADAKYSDKSLGFWRLDDILMRE